MDFQFQEYMTDIPNNTTGAANLSVDLKPFDFVGEAQIAGDNGACYSCGGHLADPLVTIHDEASCTHLNTMLDSYAKHGTYAWAKPTQTRTNACLVMHTQDSTIASPVQASTHTAGKVGIVNPKFADICVCPNDKGSAGISLKDTKQIEPTYARLLQEHQNLEQTYNPFGHDSHFAIGLAEGSTQQCADACSNARGDLGNVATTEPDTIVHATRFWA